MPLVQKTLNMGAGAGYVVDLPAPGCGRLDVLAKAEAWVQLSTDPDVAAPGATPAPGADLQADWVHLAANERLVVDLNLGILSTAAPQRPV